MLGGSAHRRCCADVYSTCATMQVSSLIDWPTSLHVTKAHGRGVYLAVSVSAASQGSSHSTLGPIVLEASPPIPILLPYPQLKALTAWVATSIQTHLPTHPLTHPLSHPPPPPPTEETDKNNYVSLFLVARTARGSPLWTRTRHARRDEQSMQRRLRMKDVTRASASRASFEGARSPRALRHEWCSGGLLESWPAFGCWACLRSFLPLPLLAHL